MNLFHSMKNRKWGGGKTFASPPVRGKRFFSLPQIFTDDFFNPCFSVFIRGLKPFPRGDANIFASKNFNFSTF